jgi:hypothetical protein
MRKITALPLAAIVAVGLVACDTDSPSLLAPADFDAKATSVAADVLGSFNVGGLGGWVYSGPPGFTCDQFGNVVSVGGVVVPNPPAGTTCTRAEGTTTHYVVTWPARHVENKSSTHLNFSDDVYVRLTLNLGVIGKGETVWAPVFVFVDGALGAQVGEARLDLSQYVDGWFVGSYAEDGTACLLQDPTPSLQWKVDDIVTFPDVASLCW